MSHTAVKTMKAIAIERFGGIDALKMFDLPKPEPQTGEVLIRVHGAGVGIWDSLQRAGELAPDHPVFPMVLGAECAGEVESLGSGVGTLHEGERVFTYFYGKQGAYAQYVAVKAEYVARKPETMSYLEAAGVPTDGITAHQAIVDEIKLRPGESFFVAGGAGGVGLMAVQIAINLGARVIASARRDNFELLESFGIAHDNLIDYAQSDVVEVVKALTGGKGADSAIDAVGGKNVETTIKAVRDGGRLAELTGNELPAQRQITVAHIQSIPSAARLDTLRELIDAHKLNVKIDQVFTLAHAREAQAAVEHHHGAGKIVLSVE